MKKGAIKITEWAETYFHGKGSRKPGKGGVRLGYRERKTWTEKVIGQKNLGRRREASCEQGRGRKSFCGGGGGGGHLVSEERVGLAWGRVTVVVKSLIAKSGSTEGKE